MTEYIQKTKEYYEALKAKYEAWMSLVKLLALVGGIAFSGYTAIEKVTAPDVESIKSNINKIAKDIESTPAAKKYIRMRAIQLANGRMGPAPDIDKEPVEHERRSLQSKLLGAWGWILSLLVLGYMLFSHALDHYRKRKGSNGNSQQPPRVI